MEVAGPWDTSKWSIVSHAQRSSLQQSYPLYENKQQKIELQGDKAMKYLTKLLTLLKTKSESLKEEEIKSHPTEMSERHQWR